MQSVIDSLASPSCYARGKMAEFNEKINRSGGFKMEQSLCSLVMHQRLFYKLSSSYLAAASVGIGNRKGCVAIFPTLLCNILFTKTEVYFSC